MGGESNIEEVLRSEELRAGFLRYTRQAYALLPQLAQPRVLDIGCGTGLVTVELARLSGGQIVGIDPAAPALATLQQRVEAAGLGERVTAMPVSLFDAGLADGEFDLLWEEGVLHLLDAARSIATCCRLLRPGGFLVMHETVAWLEGARAPLDAAALTVVARLPLPRHCWWTDYYAPLEARVRRLREGGGEAVGSAELAEHERQIAMVKNDPGRFDCAFLIVQKHHQ